MARFAINDDEQQAMQGLPHMTVCMYLALRRRMDYSTGIVGHRHHVSRQALAEDLYVEGGQGVDPKACGSPSVAAIRWSLDKLKRAGLIQQIEADMQLIFRLPLADVESVRAKEVQPKYSRSTAEEVPPEQTQQAQGNQQEVQPKYSRSTAEEVPPTSGIRLQEVQNPLTTFGLQPVQLAAPAPAAAVARKGSKLSPEMQALCRQTWQSYAAAYEHRHGAAPLQDARVNAQVVAVVKRLGAVAPEVAAYYVGHPGSYYVAKLHPVGLLLTDAEKLHTEWTTGRRMTQAQAQQQDRTGTNASALQAVMAKREAERKASHG